MRFFAIGWWSTIETFGEVGVAEPDDGVFAGEGGSEQGQVGGVERVEASDTAPAVGSGPARHP